MIQDHLLLLQEVPALNCGSLKVRDIIKKLFKLYRLDGPKKWDKFSD